MNSFIWAREQLKTKNANCAFVLDFDLRAKSQLKIEVSAHCMYKLFIDGSLRLFGPARAAKGYCRLDRKALSLRAGTHRIVAVVSAYNIAAYNYVQDIPFFYCNVKTPESEYNAADFRCYDFAIRVKKVQRFSFQRGFLEQYVQDSDLSEYLNNPELFGERLETVVVPDRKFLCRRVPYAKMQFVRTDTLIQSGRVEKDDGLPVWRDRAIDGVGELSEGYRLRELDECVAHTLSHLTYAKTVKRRVLDAERYSIYDFGRNVSGFIGVKLTVLEDASIYLLFDEILDEKSGVIDFKRLNCTNAIKWELKAGKYDLQTIEPYTLRFAQINVVAGKVKVEEVNVLTVENGDAFRLRFETADKALEKILAAAQNTVAQNSPDLLIDCPSRERAGWINDVYYSRHSATMFTGNYNVLHDTLENFLLAHKIPQIPDKMIPMCYPSEHPNGDFIPNCAMWYVIVMCEYIMQSNAFSVGKAAAPQIDGVMEYFADYENEDGLLEDLDGGIFIEWSQANSRDFVCGVNYPSNMIYYKMLKSVNALRHCTALEKKCARIKEQILKQSFNGEFFEDNHIRENGTLVPTGHTSEACQYHAFFSGIATPESHPELYKKLLSEFGPRRKTERCYPNVDKANIITGLMMRETMLLKYGEAEQCMREIKDIYGVMAERTNTLWENVSSEASCNHGIAAYAACLIVSALTGFEGFHLGEARFSENYLGADCRFFIPWQRGGVFVEVKKGIRRIEQVWERRGKTKVDGVKLS